jgi:putative membrane protein insertion efficiency factor
MYPYPLRFFLKERFIACLLTVLWLNRFIKATGTKPVHGFMEKTRQCKPVFWIISGLHVCYLVAIRPWLHGQCRFDPTCSVYCVQAFRMHNPFRAFILTLWRLARCHPWGHYAQDPVPPNSFSSS